MKKKMLAAAIASALAVPSAFAAIDDAGMKYTSASEGLYGSLRFALQSQEDNDANVDHESSRFGMQGDVDVGHGNTAFYRAEWRIEYDRDPDLPFETRLAYIGMRGNYGSVRFGRIWSAEYDHVFSLADVTNNVTGLISPTFRISNALRYDSPDIQGFNFSLQAQANNGTGRTTTTGGTDRVAAITPGPALFGANVPDGTAPEGLIDTTSITTLDLYDGATEALQRAYRTQNLDADGNPAPLEEITNQLGQVIGLRTPGSPAEPATPGTERTDPDDGNEFDRYVLAASYSLRGINVAATYISDQAPNSADATADEDSTTWGLGGTYGQDNWKVGYVYRDTSDFRGANGNDFTAHSFSGQVAFDKVTLRAVLEINELDYRDASASDSDVFTLEAQYSFSSKARAYINYQNRDTEEGGFDAFNGVLVDTDAGTGTDVDVFYVAYRVDF